MKATSRRGEMALALLLGVLCHALFLAAVTSMAHALANGLQIGRGPLRGAAAVAANVLLVVQFPWLHSWLLTKRGGRALAAPFAQRGGTLASTSYAILASLQLLCTFWCWSPSGIVWHRPIGALGVVQWLLFGVAWLFLLKAIRDAGAGVQTGFAGWWALFRGRAVDYGSMPERGLFAVCRQPIYLGFALVLWTAPEWSLDSLLLALAWSGYCVLGPIHKERRFAQRYGASFAIYRARVPYFFPRRIPRP